MILPDFARITEENHVPAFTSYAVDHAPLCQPDRSSPAPSPPPPIARHHRHRYLRRDLRLQVLGGDRRLWPEEVSTGCKPSWNSLAASRRRIPSAGCSLDSSRLPSSRVFGVGCRALATTSQAVKQIAIDGKTVRRSHDRGAGKSALHLVSAWATANHLTLGQVAVSDKSNEITATSPTVGVARPLRGRRDH